MTEGFPCRHFSFCNPRNDGPTDLPRLLRRLADEIEESDIQADDVISLTIGHNITEDGPWWQATVVWAPGDHVASSR